MIAAVAYWKGWRAISLLLLVGFLSYFVYAAASHPTIDWDMVPYTLSVLGDAERTWAVLQDHLSPADYQGLTDAGGISYRSVLFAHPELLASQLPLYENKLGFVMLLRLLSRFVDPVTGMTVISLVCAPGILLVLFRFSRPLAGVASLSWLVLNKLFDLPPSMANPDLAEAFIALLGLWALLTRRLWLAAVLLVFAAIVRPDGAVLGCTVGLAMLSQSRPAAIALIAGSLTALVLDGQVSHHFGWWGQFYFNFISGASVATADLRDFHPAFSLHQYFEVLARQSAHLLHETWLYAGVGATMLTVLLLDSDEDRPAALLLVALLAAMVLRFLAYPSIQVRLYWAFVFGLCLLVMRVAGARLSERVPCAY